MLFALRVPDSGFCKNGLMDGQLAETCRQDKNKVKIYCRV
jgi:hypothetical protein